MYSLPKLPFVAFADGFVLELSMVFPILLVGSSRETRKRAPTLDGAIAAFLSLKAGLQVALRRDAPNVSVTVVFAARVLVISLTAAVRDWLRILRPSGIGNPAPTKDAGGTRAVPA